MHTLPGHDGKPPTYVDTAQGSVGDNKRAYTIPLQKGPVTVDDCCYNDLPMPKVWDSKGTGFLARHKHNLAFHGLREKELPENTVRHVPKDEVVELSGPQPKEKYPPKLRRAAIWDGRDPTNHPTGRQQF